MNRDIAFNPSTATALSMRTAAPSLWRRLVLTSLVPMKLGQLEVELPNGERLLFGTPAVEAVALPLGVSPFASLRVRRERFFRRTALGGDIGFAEAFMEGDWETPDLTAVIAWFIHNVENAPTLSGSQSHAGRGLIFNLLRFAHRAGHLLRDNSLKKAKRNIQDHYDLSNEFFALFLDPTLMYSSAKYTRPGLTLEDAQAEKNEALCRSLRIHSSDHVLEIGSGWGGWCLHAARHHGCRVTTVTLSEEQRVLANQRIAQAGLADRIEVKLQDYRDITGQYDKIVSIEMMEAIGHQYLPVFCGALSRLLKRDGLLALQFITCPDARYAQFKNGVDFIQKHIFPGSLLLSLNRVNDCLSKAGGFDLHQLTDLGHDYALTLREWHARFQKKLVEVRALGFDERFIRKWSYYFCYCEAAFALRNISVVQTLHSRSNNLAL